jgi:hypothetical protein
LNLKAVSGTFLSVADYFNMKKTLAIVGILLSVVGVILVTGCVHERHHHHQDAVVTSGAEEIEVTEAPPPPVAESITISPGAGYVWVPGAWDWRGTAWVWEQGRWSTPPTPGAYWVPHRYEERNGKRVFIRGNWER